MAVGTRKSNANVHPGQIVLESQNTRCTSKEVEADKSHAKAAAIAVRESEEARNKYIVEVEDVIQRNEDDVQLHTNRPDLCNKPTPGSIEQDITVSDKE